MSQPIYLRPASLAEALQALSRWGKSAWPLAGGTDLLAGMRKGQISPQAVVDITTIRELGETGFQDGYVTVGALVTHSRIEQGEELACLAPVLVNACRQVGSLQIRNRGTLGGNMGNASPSADTLPPLYVLDAEVRLLSSAGERWLPVARFFLGPGQTARRPDELIAGVRFRPFEATERGFFRKIGQRRAVSISKASVAGAVLLEGGLVRRCRLALGAVAPTVIRVPAAEEYLAGKLLTTATVEEAARLAAQACQPITDIRSTVEYRRRAIAVLLRRGLLEIAKEITSR